MAERVRQLGLVSAALALIGLLAKLFAFGRELVIADQFGASRETDAFFLVFTLWVQLGFGVITVAPRVFVAPYLRAREDGGDEGAARLFGGVLTSQAALLLLAAGGTFLLAEPAARAFARGYTEDEVRLTASLLRWSIPTLPFAGLAALAIAVAHARGRFVVAEVAGLFVNVVAVVVLVALAGRMGIAAAALGGSLGCGVMLLITVGWLVRAGALPRWSAAGLGTGVRQMGSMLLLILAGHSGSYLMVIVTRAFFALLPEGQFSCHGYALRVITLPMQILMPAVLTTVLPVLAAAIARDDAAESGRLSNRAMRMLLAVMLPAFGFLVVLREPLVRALFARGAFDAADAELTAGLMLALLPAMIVVVARNVVATVEYSHGRVLAPTLTGLVAVVAYAALAPFVWRPFGAYGLAVVQAVADAVSLVAILLHGRWALGLRWPGFAGFLGRTLAACAPAVVIAIAVERVAEGMGARGLAADLAVVGLAALLAGPAFLLAARALGVREIAELVGIVTSRLRRRAA